MSDFILYYIPTWFLEWARNVDRFAERIADVEASHAPRLCDDAVDYFELGPLYSLVRLVDIIDLNGHIRDKSSRSTFYGDADLRSRYATCGEGSDPPPVHDQV